MDIIRDSYWKHIEEIKPLLPEPILTLATKTNLHDGLFREVRFDKESRQLFLGLRCGDIQQGYFDLDLDYKETTISKEDLDALMRSVKNPKIEVLYDETYVDVNTYTHNILLWPYQEIEIRYEGLAYSIHPMTDRQINK